MPDRVVDQQLRDRVKGMIRRDLKLGADAVIADDMPFFGGDVDLDSLDMLLLVTSIEREFGIKVPNEAVGREVFQNVATLTQYVQKQAASSGAKVVASTVMSDGGTTALSRLPHGEPFRFVTKITEFDAGKSAAGVWAVTGSEAFFAGHFPGNPIVPGVLLAEALAQLSGIAAGTDAGGQGKLVHVDVRFEQAVAPPANITLRSKAVGGVGSLRQFEVEAKVEEKVVARGNLTLHLSGVS